MYTSRSSLPFGIKPAGLGAAFIVNGALLTALYLYIGPNIVAAIKDTVTVGRMIEEQVPPPPVDEKKKPTMEQVRETVIYQPPVDTQTQTKGPVLETTKTEPAEAQPVDPGKPEGTAETKPVDPPPPALIAAQIDPRYAGNFQPDYPASELHRERDGTVSIRVLIGTDGRVKAVEQVSATSPAFFEATRRQAMNKWRFKPATRGGTAQESWKVMNVRFTMTSQQ